MAGDYRAGVAGLEPKRVARSREVVAGAGVGLEDQLVAVRLGIAEVEEAVLAGGPVVTGIPAE